MSVEKPENAKQIHVNNNIDSSLEPQLTAMNWVNLQRKLRQLASTQNVTTESGSTSMGNSETEDVGDPLTSPGGDIISVVQVYTFLGMFIGPILDDRLKEKFLKP